MFWKRVLRNLEFTWKPEVFRSCQGFSTVIYKTSSSGLMFQWNLRFMKKSKNVASGLDVDCHLLGWAIFPPLAKLYLFSRLIPISFFVLRCKMYIPPSILRYVQYNTMILQRPRTLREMTDSNPGSRYQWATTSPHFQFPLSYWHDSCQCFCILPADLGNGFGMWGNFLSN